MPYLNLDPNFFEHPKTRRLVALLGPGADILPIRLWAYCAKVHPKNGVLWGYSAKEIEAIIGWTGRQNQACKGLLGVGYLIRAQKGFSCKDWHQHQGHLEAFSRRGRENARKRWASYASSIANSNAPAVPAVPAFKTTGATRKKPETTPYRERFWAQGYQGDPVTKDCLVCRAFHSWSATCDPKRLDILGIKQPS